MECQRQVRRSTLIEIFGDSDRFVKYPTTVF